MQLLAVQTQKDESTSEPRAFVAIAEALRTSEANQIGRGKVGEVSVIVVRPTLLGPRESGAHDVLVKNSVRPSVPLDLLSMNGHQHRHR